LTACKSNLKNLAIALELYASDHGGRYCQDSRQLANGVYLKVLPTCPAAQKDTYSETLSVSADPDQFTLFCKGEHHARAFRSYPGKKENFPQYNAERGLIDHP
jgi:hypothetical protein